MPYPNEHAARLKDPDGFDEFRRTKGGKISPKTAVPQNAAVIWGHPKGADKGTFVAQAIRFPIKSWTAAEAKKWISDNEVKIMSFEKAQASERLAGIVKSIKDGIARSSRRESVFAAPFNVLEQFVSLRSELAIAVKKMYGNGAWVNDFSDTQVVFELPQFEGDKQMGFKLYLAPYKVTMTGIEVEPNAKEAVQKTIYELKTESRQTQGQTMVALANIEAGLKKESR